MDMKFIIILSMYLVAGIHAACDDKTTCYSCANSDVGGWIPISCRWCPLTESCHAPGSVVNRCSSSQSITSKGKCNEVSDPSAPYDSSFAHLLAKFSSLAYVRPESRDLNSMNSVMQSQIDSSYELVEVLTRDCDSILQFEHCAVVIARSTRDKQIIVAFRGTAETSQLVEQVLLALTGMTNFSPTGGEVLRYNEDTHDAMYPCIKSLLEELLAQDSTYRVAVTGHSLGGAQAQLSAAHLIYDGVVSKSNLAVYTFGAPRVGDRDFAYGYLKLVGTSYRVVRKDDPVPLIVPFASHTRREIFYNTNNQITPSSSYRTCQGNEDNDNCSAKTLPCISERCLTGVHNKYFMSDVPHALSKYVSSGNTASDGKRMQCARYHL